MSLSLVALVGAPNVGKSTIFNRFVGERASIVKDTPGITRDRLYGRCEWLTKTFSVVDTGGIEIKNKPFQTEIKAQAEIAINEADLILFVVDGKLGVTGDDQYVAKLLRNCPKPVLLVVNKLDNVEKMADMYDFYTLGLGDPIAVSGAHGIGIGDLLDQIVATLPSQEEEIKGDAISFSFIGRPNVGKSSLTNFLLGEERVIVHDLAGTTRDAIDTPFEKDGTNYIAIDTAGLIKKGKLYEAVDKYSALRALRAIDRSDVCVLVLDEGTGIIDMDRHIAGYALDSYKGIVVVVNKWDLAPTGEQQQDVEALVRERFKFIPYAEVIFVSAKSGRNIDKILPAIKRAHISSNRKIPTSALNSIISDAQAMNPTPMFNNGRLKVTFAEQVSVNPPTFVMFCNNPDYAHFSYTRYLENRLREAYDFTGTPLKIIYRLKR